MPNFISPLDITFSINLFLCILFGTIIGFERALKDKPAGINTQIFVITASMLFSVISQNIPGADPSRISAQVVSGVGFLGAGIIMKKGLHGKLSNVTTAASIWLSAAIGMAIGYNLYLMASLTTITAILSSRIPHIKRSRLKKL